MGPLGHDFKAALLSGTTPPAPPEPTIVEKITAALLSLIKQPPLGFVMAFLVLVLVTAAVVDLSARRRDRAVMIVIAAVAAIAAWMIFTDWRWPGNWPRLPL